jgi:hypothetical protein
VMYPCQSTAPPPTQNRSSSNKTPPPNAATTSTTTPPTTQPTANHLPHPKPPEPKTPSAREICPAWCACDAHAQQSRKTPPRPTLPDDTDLQPSPTSVLHALAPQTAPVASLCAAATCLAVSTSGRSTPTDAPNWVCAVATRADNRQTTHSYFSPSPALRERGVVLFSTEALYPRSG